MTIRFLLPREDDFRRRTRLISHAARWLRISEYKLFYRAYEHWYGETPSDARLERIFVRFLYSGQLPHWVEDYAQQIVQQAWREDPSTIPLQRRVFALPNVLLRCLMHGWWLRHRRLPESYLHA